MVVVVDSSKVAHQQKQNRMRWVRHCRRMDRSRRAPVLRRYWHREYWWYHSCRTMRRGQYSRRYNHRPLHKGEMTSRNEGHDFERIRDLSERSFVLLEEH